MRYVLPILIALQIAFSPLCMTQMAEAQALANTDIPMSMASSMDQAEHAHHMANHTQSQLPDPLPCGHGHCFSESGLESAPAPDLELPATVAAILPTPITFLEISSDRFTLTPPEDPPPIGSYIETVVLRQ